MSRKFDENIYRENLILKKVLKMTVFEVTDTNDPLREFSKE